MDEDHEIGQDNKDNDSLGDACDTDDDNDQVCDPGETSPYCTGSDNCRLHANGPSQGGVVCVGYQTDTNGNGLGDPCDPNADSGPVTLDPYPKALEEEYGSKDCVLSSTPEVCDGTDNDGDTLTDEGYGDPLIEFLDSDSDGTADCVDPDGNTDGDSLANPDDEDDDGDWSDDGREHYMLTDSCSACEDGIGYPDWPSDFDRNTQVNLLDLLVFKPHFNADLGEPDYELRVHLNADGSNDMLDLLPFKPNFNRSCP